MTTERPTVYHQPGTARDDADAILQAELREGAARLLAAGQPLEGGLLSLAAWKIGHLSSDLAFFRRPFPSNGPADAPDDLTDDAPPTARPKRPPAVGPRHKFVDGICVAVHGTDGAVCGKLKGRGGRPAATLATVAGVTKEDPPSRALPLGDAAADKYGAGGVGGSAGRP